MGKNNPSNPARRGPAAEPSTGKPGGAIPGATLAAVAVLVVISVLNFSETRQQRTAFEERMTLLEGQITALGNKVDAAAKSAAQPRPQPGPDPNKVYTVKTDGSPAAGPKTALVTIAEFSDFQ